MADAQRLGLRLTTTLLALLLFVTPALGAEDKPVIEPYEAWFVLKIGGKKAGHMHVTLKQEGDTVVNRTAMKIAIKRGLAEMTIEQSSSFVETLEHEPIRATSSMSLGAMASQQELDFTGEAWELTTTTAGHRNTTDVEVPKEDWLTPGAVSVFMQAAIERGDKEVAVRMLDLSAGVKPISLTMKRGEQADIEVFGRVVPATQWTTTMSTMPGLAIEQWADERGQPIKQMIPLMPGMEMEMLLADKALALAGFDAPEMLAASLITPDKPIENPRKLKRAVFELKLHHAHKDFIITQTIGSNQTVIMEKDGTSAEIRIDLTKRDTQKHMAIDPYALTPSSMINSEDKKILAFVEQVRSELPAQDTASELEQKHQLATAIRDFVRSYIKLKDLSVGFASASETARTKQGDCTEHACLLAAMLRAAGIPARTVTGLVYADQFAGHEGVFGFHMWTQAQIIDKDSNGYWLDLDAAAPGQVNGFDATHIALSTSVMKDGESFNDMVTVLPLMQGMEIKVDKTEWAD